VVPLYWQVRGCTTGSMFILKCASLTLKLGGWVGACTSGSMFHSLSDSSTLAAVLVYHWSLVQRTESSFTPAGRWVGVLAGSLFIRRVC